MSTDNKTSRAFTEGYRAFKTGEGWNVYSRMTSDFGFRAARDWEHGYNRAYFDNLAIRLAHA